MAGGSAKRHLLLLPALLVIAASTPAVAQRATPTLHEPIPPDPREDVALSLSLAGDIPAGIEGPRGMIPAPDPARPLPRGGAPYQAGPQPGTPDGSFRPDRDTHRPDMLPYDDPFSPSTAPFKRLSAFDRVDASYTLLVRDARLTELPLSDTAASDGSEDLFYGDMVVGLTAGAKVRVPSVGPGTRILRARAAVGAEDVPIKMWKDGAENWFVESDRTTRARLVMQLSIPKTAFGGDYGDPRWGELPPVMPLPASVDRTAAEVAAHIGASRRQRPREVLDKLVAYFRAFTDSDEPPPATRDIYLDLALSKKGVCRHRSFAFMVTALHLQIPTRMVVNEAHAWVEVHDGRAYRRVDLGGAGTTMTDPDSTNVPHEPPADGFPWPEGARRGQDMADRARKDAADGNGGGGPNGGGASSSGGSAPSPSGAPSGGGAPNGQGPDPTGASGGGPDGAKGAGGPVPRLESGGASGNLKRDDRTPASVTAELASTEARRGSALHVKGTAVADGEPCKHVRVEVVLRSLERGELVLGALATDDAGRYEGDIVIPSNLPLGDWDVLVRTWGDARCGSGASSR